MKTSCEFRFGFWDVTARGGCYLCGLPESGDYARIADMNTEDAISFPDVATLEPNFGWALDGSKHLLPDDAEKDAWGVVEHGALRHRHGFSSCPYA